jgi:RHS repeat-associated protein
VTDALGNSIRYEYDTRGKLVKQTDANGRITRWEYDILGREVARILPGGQAWRTEYNDLGQISRTVDPNGQSIIFTYDSLGRQSTKTRSDGAVFTQTYTLAGQLNTVTDARGVTQFVYDVRDRLVSRTEPYGQVIRYTYDDAGRTTSMTTLGGTVRYGYDAASRLTSVTDPSGAITRYTFNAVGSLTRTDYSNGVVELREYDTNSRLTRKTATGSTGTLTDYRYTLDATGRAISFIGDGETVQYIYDAVYRLTKEQSTNGRNISFTYDAVGNRLTRTDTVSSNTYQYDVNDRLTRTTTGSTVTDFTYDEAGNQLRQQTGADHTDYTWDASNRMIRASVTKAGSTKIEEYKYDASGNRVAVVNDGGETRFLLDLNGQLSQVAAEYTPSGLLIATSVRGNGAVGETRNGVSSILLTDRLGSVRVVTGATGAELARYAYDAFGNIVASSGGAGTQLRFTGEPQSLITGLDYFRARNYDSTTGHFVSADPFVGVLGNAFSRHRYQYGDVDPVNKTDPSGLYSLAEVFTSTTISNAIEGLQNLSKAYSTKTNVQNFSDGIAIFTYFLMSATSFALGATGFGTSAVKSSFPLIAFNFTPPAFGYFTKAASNVSINGKKETSVTFQVDSNLEKTERAQGPRTSNGMIPTTEVNTQGTGAIKFGIDITNMRVKEFSMGVGTKYNLYREEPVKGLRLVSIDLSATLLQVGYTPKPTQGDIGFPTSLAIEITLFPAFKFSFELFPGLFLG